MSSRRLAPMVLAPLVMVSCFLDPEAGNHQPHAGDEPVGQTSEAAKNVCPPADAVKGIDIASYQHPNGAKIDWATVAKSKKFVIIKATEGTGYKNKYFDQDIKDARAAGLVVGAYHFLNNDSSGLAQAQHFMSAIGGKVPAGDLPPMLDVEDTDHAGTTTAQRVAIMKAWLDHVQSVIGRKPMIYSGSWYWDGHLGTPKGFGSYPMSWSNYTASCPSVPDDFTNVVVFQYKGGGGKTAGIQGDCDQDEFYGDMSKLLAFAGGKAPDYEGASLGVDGQSYPIASKAAVNVKVGQTVKGWIKLKNTGSATWKPGSVWLAPIPRDKASAFVSPGWKSPTRISSVTANVAPGQTGTFELDITGSKTGESLFELGWVAEGVTWFADAPKGGGPKDGYFAVKVNVEAGSGGAGGSGGSGQGGKSGSAGAAGKSGAAGKGEAGQGEAGAGSEAGASGEAGAGDEGGAAGAEEAGGAGPAGSAGEEAGGSAAAGKSGSSGQAGSKAGAAGSSTAAGAGGVQIDYHDASDTSSEGGCGVSRGSSGGAAFGLGLGLAAVVARRRRGG